MGIAFLLFGSTLVWHQTLLFDNY